MKRITFSEVADEVDSLRGPAELCAVAEAAFDEAASRLIVQVNCHLRLKSFEEPGETFRESWLPAPSLLRETVSPEDACALTRELFQSWLHTVRRSVLETATANMT
jgi:hypothetical protein